MTQLSFDLGEDLGNGALPARRSPEWYERFFPASYLRQRLDYDPDTGLLTWRHSVGIPQSWLAKYVGRIALDALTSDGYRRGTIDGQSFSTHRVVWAIQTGFWPVLQIDHINRVRSDNRFANLREATSVDNQRNTCPDGSGAVPARGVYLQYGQFVAQIGTGVNRKRLGCFDRIEDAIAARYQAEIAYGWPSRCETLEQAQAAARAAWLARSC